MTTNAKYETIQLHIESPETLLDDLIREMREAQAEVQEMLIDAIAEQKRREVEHRKILHQISEWQSKAELAARQRDKTAKSTARQQVKIYTAQEKAIEESSHCQKETATLLRLRLDELSEQITNAEQQRADWMARFQQPETDLIQELESADIWADLQQRQSEAKFPELETGDFMKLFTKLEDE